MIAITDLFDRFDGALMTSELVGRTGVIAQIDALLQAPTPHPRLVTIMGDGGIGKTRLLMLALQRAARMGVPRAVGMVDMYHIGNHVTDGLVDTIYKVLTPPLEPFARYAKERALLNRMRLAGESSDQRAKMLEAFVADLCTLAAHKPVVLGFDTAERLVYSAGQAAGLPIQFAESWLWLLDALKDCANLTVFVAGRKQMFPIIDNVSSPWIMHSIEIGPFSPDESDRYFTAAATTARKRKQDPVARRIENLPPEVRRFAHWCAQGRPILLALLVDTLRLPGYSQTLLGILRPPHMPEEPALLEEAQQRFEEQLIARIKETPRIGDTIVALGRLPKGATPALLARVLGVSIIEARERLDEVSELSFIKRPAGGPFFLHDELYALLRRHIIDQPDDAPQAELAADVIIRYYREQLDENRRRFNQLYEPLEYRGREPDLDQLTHLNNERMILMSDMIYYRLRQNAVRGFQLYYRYTREAVLSGESTLDLQFQIELLSYLAEREVAQIDDDGLDRGLAHSMIALRSVVRAFTEQRYDDVIGEAAQVRQQYAELLAANPTAEVMLKIWEANALVYLGDADSLERAHSFLNEAIAVVTPLASLAAQEQNTKDLLIWRAQAALALAHRVRGYMHRVGGALPESVNDYGRAAVIWRQVNIRIELATTLNSMGFAMAELGRFTDARTLVMHALTLRRQLGPRAPVALSINTLGLIETREGNYDKAAKLAEQALRIFRALPNQRGIGLALIAMAEALRRRSRNDVTLNPEQAVDLLRKARDYAWEAQRIFGSLNEPMRQVEALIEEGCANREWLFIRKQHPDPADDTDRLLEEGMTALRHAEKLAAPSLPYRSADALVNLAWLCHYDGRDDQARAIAQEADDYIGPEYDIDRATGGPRIERHNAQILMWPLLGKLNTLYGHQAYARYIEQHATNGAAALATLRDVAFYYVFSLEYNARFADDYRDIRRSKDEIYDRLKDLSIVELLVVAQSVLETEQKYNLKPIAPREFPSVMQEFLRYRALWYQP